MSQYAGRDIEAIQNFYFTGVEGGGAGKAENPHGTDGQQQLMCNKHKNNSLTLVSSRLKNDVKVLTICSAQRYNAGTVID